MLKIAFKEWAVICRALALGRQAMILRKGGIAEVGGEFRPEHERFWLYPTYLHEHRDGVKADATPLLEQALAEGGPEGWRRRRGAGDDPRHGRPPRPVAAHRSDRWRCFWESRRSPGCRTRRTRRLPSRSAPTAARRRDGVASGPGPPARRRPASSRGVADVDRRVLSDRGSPRRAAERGWCSAGQAGRTRAATRRRPRRRREPYGPNGCRDGRPARPRAVPGPP